MKKHSENNNNSQLDKVNAALMALTHNVTSEDRKEAPASEFTQIQYLKGRGKDLGTGFKLLEYYQARIEEREKKLQGAA